MSAASNVAIAGARAIIRTPRPSVWSIITAASVAGWACAAPAETMQSALVKSYQNNPQLNAQRANARSIDENVRQALSGYRPKLAITGSIGAEYVSVTSKTPSPQGPIYTNSANFFSPWTVGVTGTQTPDVVDILGSQAKVAEPKRDLFGTTTFIAELINTVRQELTVILRAHP